jgi:hypothetical protein
MVAPASSESRETAPLDTSSVGRDSALILGRVKSVGVSRRRLRSSCQAATLSAWLDARSPRRPWHGWPASAPQSGQLTLRTVLLVGPELGLQVLDDAGVRARSSRGIEAGRLAGLRCGCSVGHPRQRLRRRLMSRVRSVRAPAPRRAGPVAGPAIPRGCGQRAWGRLRPAAGQGGRSDACERAGAHGSGGRIGSRQSGAWAVAVAALPAAPCACRCSDWGSPPAMPCSAVVDAGI